MITMVTMVKNATNGYYDYYIMVTLMVSYYDDFLFYATHEQN